MAIIHRTTLIPPKLELLAAWLPGQPWYSGAGRQEDLARVGGFRLDDPEGEVGIEFMVAVDSGPGGPVAYQVPLTYRGSALAGAEDALVGTAEHGVLGPRWVYDGTRDPVVVAQLTALLQGRAEPQAQSQTDTPDPTVHPRPVGGELVEAADWEVTADGPESTELLVRGAGGKLAVRVHRVLRPIAQEPADAGQVTATWLQPDETRVRGVFATARRVG